MNNDFSFLLIDKNEDLKTALGQMDRIGHKLLIVVENSKFYSILSIGDVQRAIIRENTLDIPVKKVLRKDVKVAAENDDLDEIKNQMKQRRNEYMPVISENGDIKDIIFWEDLFKQEKRETPQKINLPVVIMAGGKGTRMRPLTNVIPKPLIPVNKKTIIENIMDRFVEYGCHNFYLSVNYKADFIKYYFNRLNNSDYIIEYFEEGEPLGTAGSLSLLKDKINETFFVSNCDIIIKEDYNEIIKYHYENKNELTIVAAMKHYPIPYGILKTGKNSQLKELEEKPELIFKINSGMYVVEPQVLKEIPDSKFLNITDLINRLLEKGRNIGVFPVTEKSWRDIGTWDEYIRKDNF